MIRVTLALCLLLVAPLVAQDKPPATADDVHAVKAEIADLKKQLSEAVTQIAALAQRQPGPSLADRQATAAKTVDAAKAQLKDEFGPVCRSITLTFDVTKKITGFTCQPQ